MTERLECAICGDDGRDVRVGIVHWVDINPAWDAVPRCIDREACAGRVSAAGRSWPVISGRSPITDNTRSFAARSEAAARIRTEYDAWAKDQPPEILDRRPPRLIPATGRVAFPPALPVPPLPTIPPAPNAGTVMVAEEDPASWW